MRLLCSMQETSSASVADSATFPVFSFARSASEVAIRRRDIGPRENSPDGAPGKLRAGSEGCATGNRKASATDNAEATRRASQAHISSIQCPDSATNTNQNECQVSQHKGRKLGRHLSEVVRPCGRRNLCLTDGRAGVHTSQTTSRPRQNCGFVAVAARVWGSLTWDAGAAS